MNNRKMQVDGGCNCNITAMGYFCGIGDFCGISTCNLGENAKIFTQTVVTFKTCIMPCRSGSNSWNLPHATQVLLVVLSSKDSSGMGKVP